MGTLCPKQYLQLGHKPILQHTLERLSQLPIQGMVVCIAANDCHWEHLTLPKRVMQIVGGQERCHSVLKGLEKLYHHAQSQDWVLVHDAARPCVRIKDIQCLMEQLVDHPVGGILATPVRDTMKRTNAQKKVLKTVNRHHLWHALTPQMFRLELLTHALEQALERGQTVTDEAEAVEQLGYSPVLIEGHTDNLKITHPQDLELAALYLQQQNTYAS